MSTLPVNSSPTQNYFHTQYQGQEQEKFTTYSGEEGRSRGEIPKEREFMEKETTHSKAELASAAAIQKESFVRITILKEQDRLTQARDDAIAEAQSNILWEESKQKLSREREIHEKKMLALGMRPQSTWRLQKRITCSVWSFGKKGPVNCAMKGSFKRN
jgi:hypothetical protein